MSRRAAWYAAAARARRRNRLFFTVLPALTVCAVAGLTLESLPAAEPAAQATRQPQAVLAHMPLPPAGTPARRMYPYSVVPGGLLSPAELVNAVTADKVVATHYADIDIPALRPAQSGARSVYVSYRKGDKIFWTSHKVKLAEGEAILTDGVHEIRGRCGNRISEQAQLPVASNEPSGPELDRYLERNPEAQLARDVAQADAMPPPRSAAPANSQDTPTSSTHATVVNPTDPTASTATNAKSTSEDLLDANLRYYGYALAGLPHGPITPATPAQQPPLGQPATAPRSQPVKSSGPSSTGGPLLRPATTPESPSSVSGGPAPPGSSGQPPSSTTPLAPAAPRGTSPQSSSPTPPPAEVSEPGTLWLVGGTLLLLWRYRKKRDSGGAGD